MSEFLEIAKVTLNIPIKEFGVDLTDKFQDYFTRIKTGIAIRLNFNDNFCCSPYDLETTKMFLKAFKESKVCFNNIPPKSRAEILTDIRRKLEKFHTQDYPVFSRFRKEDLLILIPEQYYLELKNDSLDIFTTEIMSDTIFGVKMKIADVNKIYVAYDEPEDKT